MEFFLTLLKMKKHQLCPVSREYKYCAQIPIGQRIGAVNPAGLVRWGDQGLGNSRIYGLILEIKIYKLQIMKVVALVLLAIWSSFQNQILGGQVVISDKKIRTLQKDEDNFALIKRYTGVVLSRNCKFTVGEAISARYHVVQGINYTAVFNTSYGPFKTVALTTLWLGFISVSSMSFTDFPTTGEIDPKIQNFSVADLLLNQFQQSVSQKQQKYEIPSLKNICLKIQTEKKSAATQPAQTEATSKPPATNISNAARNLQSLTPLSSVENSPGKQWR